MPVTLNSVLQVLLFLVIVLLLTKPLGLYMYKIFNGERTWLSPVFVPVERFFYRLCGINPEEEQKWTGYMISVLIFSVVGMLLLYLIERTQQWHGSFFIPQGPVASMEVIKDLGTNGGGFFNVNAAHPFENPNALSALLILLCEITIGAALFYMFGKWVGDTRQGWALWIVSAILFVIGLAVIIPAEQTGNPLLTKAGANQGVSATQAGGDMEGKEVRYGITVSAIQEETTTATSTGTVMSFHDSYTPLGGLVLITNIALGELIFGGVGAGLYSMLYFAIIAVFIAGLMVGRTPEYLGKKIERKEIMMAVLALLISPLLVLGFTGLAMAIPQGLAGIFNPGPHGLTEVLYAYTSGNGNNGSAFAGLAPSPFYNWTMGMVMLIGRFAEIIPVLALAGSLVKKRVVPAGLGTFPTTGPLFVGLMIGVILIIGALTYFPAYSLGPIVEHLLMQAGRVF